MKIDFAWNNTLEFLSSCLIIQTVILFFLVSQGETLRVCEKVFFVCKGR